MCWFQGRRREIYIIVVIGIFSHQVSSTKLSVSLGRGFILILPSGAASDDQEFQE